MRLMHPWRGTKNRGHLISGGWIFVKDAAILRAAQCDVNEQAPHHLGVTFYFVPNMMTFGALPAISVLAVSSR